MPWFRLVCCVVSTQKRMFFYFLSFHLSIATVHQCDVLVHPTQSEGDARGTRILEETPPGLLSCFCLYACCFSFSLFTCTFRKPFSGYLLYDPTYRDGGLLLVCVHTWSRKEDPILRSRRIWSSAAFTLDPDPALIAHWAAETLSKGYQHRSARPWRAKSTLT